MFAADRVQSSPCILQTDHIDSSESDRVCHEPMQEEEARAGLPAGTDKHGMDAFLQGDSSCGFRASLASDLAKSCHLDGVTALPADAWYSGTQKRVSLEAESPGMTILDPQASLHPSTATESALQQGAGTQIDCQRLDQPSMQVELASNQAMLADEHMICCSDTSAVEAAAEAAGLSGLTATSSPCCTFQLPTALSQGIAASPAAAEDTGSEGSARRKSFSPLESGPVSILPLVENALIGLPSVSCNTLARLITMQHGSPSTQLKIVDCRWAAQAILPARFGHV